MADQASEGLLSPFLRRRRFVMAIPHLRGRVLDVGCGAGHLAARLAPSDYVGQDVDEESLEIARSMYPMHRFGLQLPKREEKFDTIIALAVIEHVPNPRAFLAQLAERLVDAPESRIICTTPHPALDWIHDVGAKVGLFSAHASDEHEELLDAAKLRAAGEPTLELVGYRRFLCGANQLAVYQLARVIAHSQQRRRASVADSSEWQDDASEGQNA
jgi:SAM-dependent methyltransferase